MIVVPTDDGSATVRSDHFGDTYHSLRGAVGEARHVFIETGFRAVSESCSGDFLRPIRVLEMGFGTGLNAWLTLVEGRAVDYTAVELWPVDQEVVRELKYTDDRRFAALHAAPWSDFCVLENDLWSEISPGFRLRKLHGEMARILDERRFAGEFDLVYWDAFAPDTQPELWTAELFARVFEAAAAGAVLVTYSAKGDVRRALMAAGFEVEKLPGALGKRHMLRAKKQR